VAAPDVLALAKVCDQWRGVKPLSGWRGTPEQLEPRHAYGARMEATCGVLRIDGRRYLRQSRASDASAVFAIVSDPTHLHIMRGISFERIRRGTFNATRWGPVLWYTVCDKDGEVVGSVELQKYPPGQPPGRPSLEHAAIVPSIVLRSDHQRAGVPRAIEGPLLLEADPAVRYPILAALIEIHNVPSQRAAAKGGMTLSTHFEIDNVSHRTWEWWCRVR
jgi:RimJ/RimL family protein N-acetyltransferase